MVSGPMDFTSPIKSIKKPSSKPRQSILSPNTLKRISRPQRHELSPTPLPLAASRKTFKSTTPKKQKLSKSAGVLKRLQKTEVNFNHTVQSKKVKRTLARTGSSFGGRAMGGGNREKVRDVGWLKVDDGAEVQVPATPAPKKTMSM